MRSRYTIVLGLASLLIVLDQATKLIIAKSIPLGSEQEVIPGFFNLVHVLNRGAAFSFLNRGDISWQRYLFIGISCLASLLILYLVRMAKENDRLMFWGFGFILGGAIGNLVDRIRIGSVVDFLDFYLGPYHWPAFNVADSSIFVGACLLILGFFLGEKRKTSPSEEA